MPLKTTRRRFVRTGLSLGAGILGISKRNSSLIKAQAQLPDEEPYMYLDLTGAIRQVHDPSIIKDGDTYYLFCTHGGIYLRKSIERIDGLAPEAGRRVEIPLSLVARESA